LKQKNFIFGIHPVIEAIRSGKEIEKILLQKGLRGEGFRDLFNLCKELDIHFQFVPPEKLNSLSKQNHQGVIAFLSEVTYQRLEDIIPYAYEQGRPPLILILDRITDVRNMGAIARTAECAGVDALVIPLQGSAQINSEAIKASAGALYKLPVCRSRNLKDELQFLHASGIAILAATEKADQSFTAADMTGPLALIMGNEGEGIARELLALADGQISIPVAGEIGSLNVSVAAGVILYEAMRQRKASS
jgi:23S rRNA (guanosine2251-2'-O)-methyltransferase